MQVLVCLADASGEVMSRTELMDAVWPGMTVTDDVLTQCIVELRRAFDDDARKPAVIETIPRVGFRLIAPVTQSAPASGNDRAATPSWGIGRSVAVTLLVAFAGVILWFATDRQKGDPLGDAPEPGAASIAVLPFVNISDDTDNEYFSDGLSEELLNLLSRVPRLKVIGRTSSFAFKGRNEDLRVIGRTLGVNTLLEGSVMKSGDRVRIRANLVDATDGSSIWSDSYDRELTNIFDVQDDVAAAIVEVMQIHVGSLPTRGRPTASTEAYALFLRARVLLNDQNGRDAAVLLKQAVALDPEFAEAQELLAYSDWQQAGFVLSLADGLRLSRAAAAAALDLNPNLDFARALFHLAGNDRNGLSGIQALEKHLRENPADAAARRTLIYELTARGYLREAHELAEDFIELDPLSPVANYTLGEMLFAVGQREEAFLRLNIAWELDNEFAQWFVPAANLAAGRDEIAIMRYESRLARDGIADVSWVSEAVSMARDPDNGRAFLEHRIPQILARIPEEQRMLWRADLMLWYLIFGFTDAYFDTIDEEITGTDRSNEAAVLVWQGHLFPGTGFVGHDRYLQIAESLGLTETWMQRDAPDFCTLSAGAWNCESGSYETQQ